MLGGNPNPTNSPEIPIWGDNSIAYWDETPITGADGQNNQDYVVSSNTIGDGQLHFIDFPRQVIPLTELIFEDVLAGVDAFGKVTPLYYPGTAFTWTYSEDYVPGSGLAGVSLYGNIDPSLGGTGSVTALAFTDARIPTAAIPEPSTWALMALGFGGLSALGWRRVGKTGRVAEQPSRGSDGTTAREA